MDRKKTHLSVYRVCTDCAEILLYSGQSMVFNKYPLTRRTPTHLFPFDLEASQFDQLLVASVSDFSFPR